MRYKIRDIIGIACMKSSQCKIFNIYTAFKKRKKNNVPTNLSFIGVIDLVAKV